VGDEASRVEVLRGAKGIRAYLARAGIDISRRTLSRLIADGAFPTRRVERLGLLANRADVDLYIARVKGAA
jgi:hypothetical protein